MLFSETRLQGAYIITPEKMEDERGFFARTFSADEFIARGLDHRFVQCSLSLNRKRGTLRGMHYQIAPFEEGKLVRCTAGSAYDVIVDLRPDSSTYRKWIATELTQENRHSIYIPKGVAHGFQTLEDNTELFYQISEFYHPECAKGFRWDDPAIGVEWPKAERIISAKDLQYPILLD